MDTMFTVGNDFTTIEESKKLKDLGYNIACGMYYDANNGGAIFTALQPYEQAEAARRKNLYPVLHLYTALNWLFDNYILATEDYIELKSEGIDFSCQGHIKFSLDKELFVLCSFSLYLRSLLDIALDKLLELKSQQS